MLSSSNIIEPWRDRVDYMDRGKPLTELPTRYRNFRPVRVKLPQYLEKELKKVQKLQDNYTKAYNKWVVSNEKLDGSDAICKKLYEKTVDLLNDYGKQQQRLKEVIEKHQTALEKLHDRDWPDNSWQPFLNKLGGTIF